MAGILTKSLVVLQLNPSFDVPGFDVPGFDVPGFDVPGFDVPDCAWMLPKL
jgi:hypothetical protein